MRPLPGDAADPTGAPRVTRPAVGSARVRHRGIRGGLVLAAVDREEALALLDHLAFLVVDAPQVAGDARAGQLDLSRGVARTLSTAR